MLARLPRRVWLDWQVYMQFEPMDRDREAIRDARLIKVLLDLTRDTKKHPQSPYKLDELILRFGDSMPAGPTRKQTWQEQKQLLFGYAKEQAAAVTARKTQRERRRTRVPRTR